MQDRYVADAGDFGKYGLLRFLASGTKLRLGINWYRTEPTQRELRKNPGDGKFINYLLQETEHDQKRSSSSRRYAARLKKCDEQLYFELQKIITSWLGNKKRSEFRCVHRIENGSILPRNIVFYAAPLRSTDRERWVTRGISKLCGCEIVFFDPDNGLIMGGSRNRSLKQVYFDEIEPYFGNGQSLIIYQHANREKGGFEKAIQEKSKKLAQKLKIERRRVIALRFRRGTARAYFVVTQEKHFDCIHKAVSDFLDLWGDHFRRVA